MTTKHRKHLPVDHRFQVPDVRLPIVNTEMTVLQRPGKAPWLATTAYSNLCAKLVLLSPHGELRTINAPWVGGLMMQSDEDGYLICGCRDLVRFDPESERVEVLAENVVSNDEIWGGGITRNFIVVGSSTPEGTVAIYDRNKRRIVKSITPIHPRAFYTYRVLEAPDGRVLVMSSLPGPVVTLIDQETLSIEQFEPDALRGLTNQHGGQFLASDTLYLHSGGRAFLLKYPGFELIAEIPAPDGAKSLGNKTILFEGEVVAWAGGTNRLYRLDLAEKRWDPLVEEPIVPLNSLAPVGCRAFAGLEDGAVCGITDSNVFFRIEKGSRQAQTKPLNVTGPSNGQPLIVVKDGSIQKAFGSSHVLQRFWEVDIKTGKGKDLGDSGPGRGQINDMVWDKRQKLLFMASYTSASLIVYDPARGGQFPENPRVFARVGHDQMRPLQLIQDNGAVWMTTTSKYGYLGGALSRIDLTTGKTNVYCDLVSGQTPVRMLISPDHDEIYVSMTIDGTCCSAIPVADSAHLVVFSTTSRKVIRSFAPLDGAPLLKLLSYMPDWRVLFQNEDRYESWKGDLWEWHTETDAIRRIGQAPKGGIRESAINPKDKKLWASGCDGIGPLILDDPCHIESVIDPRMLKNFTEGIGKYLQWDGDLLWFILGAEIVGVRLEKC